jgi:hypothetical protein
MTQVEIELFKGWIAGQLKTRNLTPEHFAPDGYRRDGIKKFVQDETRCASIEVRDTLAKGLGYQDFIGLYEDYKTQEGGEV